jgi:hypothetical protein
MTTKPDDGGPAFPCSWIETDPNFPPEHLMHPGLSLRDYFAGQAMQAIFGGVGARDVADRDRRYDETNWAEVVAANAYEMADAMLAERKP